MSEFGFWMFLTVSVVLFSGEPDLLDRLIYGQDCNIMNEIRLDAAGK